MSEQQPENPVTGWLSRIITRVKPGPGVVGNTSYAVIAGVIVAGLVVYSLRTDPWLALGAMVLVLGFLVYFVRGTWEFARSHPGESLTSGPTYVHYIQTIAAQGHPVIPISPPIDRPAVIDQGGVDDEP